jgi:dTDP-4-dehydrorhamnose reductase
VLIRRVLARTQSSETAWRPQRASLRAAAPAIILNAAAYTVVDRAESEPEHAMAVNARAPGILAEEAL